MKKIFATAAVAMLALSGCEIGEEAKPGDEITEYVFRYNGNDLHCVGSRLHINNDVLSCDFVRYHNENGASNG